MINATPLVKQQYLRTLVPDAGYLAQGVRKMPVSDQIKVPCTGHKINRMPFFKAAQCRAADAAARAVFENELRIRMAGLQQCFQLLFVF